jgi:diacylglycerol kinase family enzyme
MIAIVLNPASGKMRRAGLRDEIETLCREAGLDADIRETRGPGEVCAAAREALANDPEVIVAGGGDGTVSGVASVLAGHSVPLGVLPLGTLNHFAKDLDIPVDHQKAIAIIAERRVRPIDVGRVNDRVFVNNSSIGVYPSIVEARERLRERGRSKWTSLLLATLEVLRQDDDLAVRLETERNKIIARTPFVFVGNNEYQSEGIGLGSRPRLDGRRVYAYFAPPLRTRRLPNLLAHALFHRAGREHLLTSVAAAELWIDTPLTSIINVACDGELETMATPLHYRSWPGALRVIAPHESG